jgi:hypothetical protein
VVTRHGGDFPERGEIFQVRLRVYFPGHRPRVQGLFLYKKSVSLVESRDG